ncbi:hypothetical protein DICPUDRAFT_34643 [Dictyostelium purpureum]|uniref:Methyltransferase small domain-containing protein n=1 Tax=Dictyostelium purpureum TaxID=5786 RepID=F0ZN30_DICPU|nr:uncharacterized protein DICPUDRAFT_34643 [Dictyostelium purpureum]EGC34641.1 hypothetical protein DICPUDRAFT_34643 [Dictyostelium purpureum]|eukprot:XP_003288822.1 hypothetical protein DICPUDRAFT_34643 [Dictyostelium purpureum]
MSLNTDLPNANEPIMDHFTTKDFKDVYEPAQDSFLFIDSLQKDYEDLKTMNPYIMLEIGSGSGFVITFLANLLGPNGRYYMSTDINPLAAIATSRTSSRNNANIDVINTSFVSSIERLKGSIDVLLFNPPYVPTPSEEVNQGGIVASWAGGINGREVIDILLPQIPSILSDKGFFYMVLVQENKPKQVISIMHGYGFGYKIVGKRKAYNEILYIFKFFRDSNNNENNNNNNNNNINNNENNNNNNENNNNNNNNINNNENSNNNNSNNNE